MVGQNPSTPATNGGCTVNAYSPMIIFMRRFVFHSTLPTRNALCLATVLSTSLLSTAAHAQGSASLGNGLSAAAIARGGSTAAERSSVLDAAEGTPAGFAGV